MPTGLITGMPKKIFFDVSKVIHYKGGHVSK